MMPLIILLGLGIAAAIGFAMAQKVDIGGVMVSLLAQLTLTGEQLQNAVIIVREFQAAKMPTSFAIAAVINAWHESALQADAYNPEAAAAARDGLTASRGSVGLFQLYDNGRGLGAGAGMSLPLVNGRPDPNDPRRDPVKNTRRIIEEIQSPKWGRRMRQAHADDEPLTTLIALFTEDIERPANATVKGRERAATLGKWWPMLANVTAQQVDFLNV